LIECPVTKKRLLLAGASLLLIIIIGVLPVSAAIPVANWTSSSVPVNGTVPVTVTFTDTSTGSPTGWTWFFGDEPYNQSWVEQNASSGWVPRQGQSAVVLPDNSIVLMGGYADGIAKNDTWRSTDKGVSWVNRNNSSGWTPRQDAQTSVLIGGKILLISGLDDGFDGISDVWLSADNGSTWTKKTASPEFNTKAGGGASTLSNNNVIVFGGANYDGDYVNDVWKTMNNGSSWYEISDPITGAEFSARGYFGTATLPDGSIIIAGGESNGGGYLNDVWRSTNGGVNWTEMTADDEWEDRTLPTLVAMPDNSLILMGGDATGGPKNDTWLSTDYGESWSLLNEYSEWSARDSHKSLALLDGSIVTIGGYSYNESDFVNDTWRFNPVGSTSQNPVHEYIDRGPGGHYHPVLQAYNNAGNSMYSKRVEAGGLVIGWNRQDILMSSGYRLVLTFQDSKNFTVIKNVSVLDSYGLNTTAADGVYNHTYTAGYLALNIHADGYYDQTLQYPLYSDYTGIVLMEPAMVVSNVRQTTYFPHLVRISCMNYLGTAISDMNVTAVVVESTSPYAWLTDIFGINTNQTQITNTTLSGTTDTDGSIAFMMVENLKYKIDFSKPGESISQTNYLYPKEGDYSYIFWSEVAPSVSGSIGIEFWNRTNLSNPAYMDLGVKYTDTGATTDWSRFTVYYENNTVLFTQNATTPNSWNLSAPVLISRGAGYIWGARANNTRYPNQIVQSQIIRFGGSPVIPYSLCPETDPDPLHPCMWNQYVALGIIFLVALLFGRATIKYASAIVVLLTLFFAYIGWLNYAPLLLSTILFLGIMFYYRYAEGESDI
jgi:hypothetical protein